MFELGKKDYHTDSISFSLWKLLKYKISRWSWQIIAQAWIIPFTERIYQNNFSKFNLNKEKLIFPLLIQYIWSLNMYSIIK